MEAESLVFFLSGRLSVTGIKMEERSKYEDLQVRIR